MKPSPTAERWPTADDSNRSASAGRPRSHSAMPAYHPMIVPSIASP